MPDEILPLVPFALEALNEFLLMRKLRKSSEEQESEEENETEPEEDGPSTAKQRVDAVKVDAQAREELDKKLADYEDELRSEIERKRTEKRGGLLYRLIRRPIEHYARLLGLAREQTEEKPVERRVRKRRRRTLDESLADYEEQLHKKVYRQLLDFPRRPRVLLLTYSNDDLADGLEAFEVKRTSYTGLALAKLRRMPHDLIVINTELGEEAGELLSIISGLPHQRREEHAQRYFSSLSDYCAFIERYYAVPKLLIYDSGLPEPELKSRFDSDNGHRWLAREEFSAFFGLLSKGRSADERRQQPPLWP